MKSEIIPQSNNIERLCLDVVAISRRAGEYIREQRKKFSSEMVESKGLHNYVSHVDKEAERIIVEGLKHILPKAGFIAEEGTGEPNTDGNNWIIDPLDGTTNFIHGLPPYAVSIALTLKGVLVLGVVYEVALDECFYSWGDGKAFLNGEPIRVSTTPTVSQSLIATGFPYYNYDKVKPFLYTLEYFMRHSHGIRRIGSAATDLAYVACGRFEAFYEYGLNPWDVAAGIFLVQQAGGVVSEFSGGNNFLFGHDIIAANDKVFMEFQQKVAGMMLTPQPDQL